MTPFPTVCQVSAFCIATVFLADLDVRQSHLGILCANQVSGGPPVVATKADHDDMESRWRLLKEKNDLKINDVDRFLGYVEGRTGLQLPQHWQASVVLSLAQQEKVDRQLLERELNDPEVFKRLGFVLDEKEICPVPIKLNDNGKLPRTIAPTLIRSNGGSAFLDNSIGTTVDIALLRQELNGEMSSSDICCSCAEAGLCLVAIHQGVAREFHLYRLDTSTAEIRWKSTVHRARRGVLVAEFLPDTLEVELQMSKRSAGVFFSSRFAHSIEVIDLESGAAALRCDLIK